MHQQCTFDIKSMFMNRFSQLVIVSCVYRCDENLVLCQSMIFWVDWISNSHNHLKVFWVDVWRRSSVLVINRGEVLVGLVWEFLITCVVWLLVYKGLCVTIENSWDTFTVYLISFIINLITNWLLCNCNYHISDVWYSLLAFRSKLRFIFRLPRVHLHILTLHESCVTKRFWYGSDKECMFHKVSFGYHDLSLGLRRALCTIDQLL